MKSLGYESFEFTDGQFNKTVFKKGKGPGIIIMHELPGLSIETVYLADYLVKHGFTVYLPLMFGEPLMPADAASTATNMARLCISKEFHLFSARETSPIVNWLRSLCNEAHQVSGGPGVGAVGMCLTGGFAIPLMIEPSMMAPALSQPSLPINPIFDKGSLGCSRLDYQAACARAKREKLEVIGFRFSQDMLAAEEKFSQLRDDLGDLFIDETIDSSLGNIHGIPIYAHSVLTANFVDEKEHPTYQARDKLKQFFSEKLL